ncbi:hypothetical protein Gbro_1169 [Gordonia bronchialis DSM 43247]|uniref:Uncharacterized protein n=1 Tax=Gordonia bronchialis (strain ATCC 25592 / DSM 43247 / BCRC 13721 / JCM 3198 / KCTC 3076 / NBRC 16047 / NCTC 10667) TaxID=526226 RepID=D0L525_GORB4|nr:hypothetical protein [Gordonia bronchialis]ACY20477.1 hypothetical protein Gbro_1169 [Gordonia bronchialis DSM 43247]MCC3323250.1 hypothetical protein [Gordonia bronchialis]QGS25738.1 hypothetical protein FOB84_17995 [Gordonia bronchialis]STQ63281.1 Uncharacterised protein [Gordonia bronchialis]STS10877.1 Uncharacterised protein [Gordonia bronchialis]
MASRDDLTDTHFAAALGLVADYLDPETSRAELLLASASDRDAVLVALAGLAAGWYEQAHALMDLSDGPAVASRADLAASLRHAINTL